MLNGIDPIIIFNFKKLSAVNQAELSKIPIISSIVNTFGLPPIPVYISQALTGLVIDSEEKNIDIETTSETKSDGSTPTVTQKGLNSTVRVNLAGSRDSIGITLLSAFCDRVFKKVTSKEYSITYLSGPVTVFNGLLRSYAISQNADNDLINISFELFFTELETTQAGPNLELQKQTGSVPL